MPVVITTEAFDPAAELRAFLADTAGAGAAVTFTGLVRADAAAPVTTLTLECYVPLAERQIADMVATATARFGLLAAHVIHRHGTLMAGEPIVQVMTLAPHRRAAFEGADFLMDYLKTDAAFWKKETTGSGEFWVESKPADDAARRRWE